MLLTNDPGRKKKKKLKIRDESSFSLEKKQKNKKPSTYVKSVIDHKPNSILYASPSFFKIKTSETYF